MSVDGFLDDAFAERLILSSEEDLEDVQQLRAEFDAILVGAGTVRSDDPSLATQSEALARAREAAGRTRDPTKVTLTRSGDLDPRARFFRSGGGDKLVYCPAGARAAVSARLGAVAEVLACGADELGLDWLLGDLERRGIQSLLVEGGSAVLTAFLEQGHVDELRLAIAPCFVGAGDAPRLVAPARFPHGPGRRMKLESVRPLGDTGVLTFRLERSR